ARGDHANLGRTVAVLMRRRGGLGRSPHLAEALSGHLSVCRGVVSWSAGFVVLETGRNVLPALGSRNCHRRKTALGVLVTQVEASAAGTPFPFPSPLPLCGGD